MSSMIAISVGSMALSAYGANQQGKAALSSSKKANKANEAISERQMQSAEGDWARYKDTFAPLEDEIAQQSRDVGSQANREQAAGEAQAGVTSSLAGLRQQLQRTPGLDPSSPQYLNAVSQLGMNEAAQSASAQTGARRQQDTLGQAKLTGAAGLGKGMTSNAAVSLSQASQTADALSANAHRQLLDSQAQAGAAGEMFGDVLNNPATQKFVGGLFS